MVDIHKRAAHYLRLKRDVASWPLDPETIGFIRGYLAEQIDQLSPGRRYADLCMLKRIFCGTSRGPRLITKPLRGLTLPDLEGVRERMREAIPNKDSFRKIAAHIRNLLVFGFEHDEDRQELLQRLFMTGRRRFFHWATDAPLNLSIERHKFYTVEEFQGLLRVAQRPIERALLAVGWESTARPNEYLALTCGDVEELPNGYLLKAHVSKLHGGVTRTRNLYVLAYRAEFTAYWRCHPFKADPRAPLFFRSDNSASLGQPLGWAGATSIIKKLDRISGVKKKGTLYFLRHGGYSWKRTQGMNAGLAAADMGWGPGSRQEHRYLHIQERDVLQERLRLAGERFEEEVRPTVESRICPFCSSSNSPVDERCSACGQTLNLQSVLSELGKSQRLIDEVIEAKIGALLEKFVAAQQSPPAAAGGPTA